MRHVAIWDTVDADGRPSLNADHPRLDDAERERVARYLEAGALVAPTNDVERDLLSESTVPVVPQSFRTDGEWVWSDEVAYYVRHHGVSPSAAFLADVRARDFRAGAVDEATLDEALRLLRSSGG